MLYILDFVVTAKPRLMDLYYLLKLWTGEGKRNVNHNDASTVFNDKMTDNP